MFQHFVGCWFSVTGNLNWFVRVATELEEKMIRVERVFHYISLPSEAPLHIESNRIYIVHSFSLCVCMCVSLSLSLILHRTQSYSFTHTHTHTHTRTPTHQHTHTHTVITIFLRQNSTIHLACARWNQILSCLDEIPFWSQLCASRRSIRYSPARKDRCGWQNWYEYRVVLCSSVCFAWISVSIA